MRKSNTLQYYYAINYYRIRHALQNLPPATQRKERLRDRKRRCVRWRKKGNSDGRSCEWSYGDGSGIVLMETVRVLVQARRVSTEALIVVESIKMLDLALRMTIDDVRV
jgi:hypothetical protein